ncbi:GntR family transcriptional regulator [bacterium]|nr:GntR family transcriptional regulator [bacterium]
MKHLTLDDIKIPRPNFESSNMPKGQMISLWLIDWVKHSLEYGIADIGDFIPSKAELAQYLNVSTATIQNSIRYVKNLGYFSSKQSTGTCIADFYSKDLNPDNDDETLFRGTIAECKIKKIVLDYNVALGDCIPSIPELARVCDISQNTIRLALSNLALSGYIEKVRLRGNKYIWLYKKEFQLSRKELSYNLKDEDFTLKHQLIEKIKNYLEKTYKQGEKILPNKAFSRMFEVSVKTINDAMKYLSQKKIILPRRGRYGTVYLGESRNSKKDFISQERKRINPVQDYTYSWQKTLEHLKKHIVQNYEQGDKLAPIRELASILNVSPNTIRRALRAMLENGSLISKAGKSGGIFIVEMPEVQDSYQWLALNPDAVKFEE